MLRGGRALREGAGRLTGGLGRPGLDLGDRLEATLQNRLGRKDEATSIHWHGIRLPNSQDGVPFLVQPLVHPGESFRYAFEPPDTGTYFFHTHCNTAEQLGRGLEGLLIVDGDVTEPYDADVVLLMRDWHVDLSSGQFNPFFSLRGAGRAGSYGAVRSVNGAPINRVGDLTRSLAAPRWDLLIERDGQRLSLSVDG